MSRGWESKSVEFQQELHQAERNSEPAEDRPEAPATPALTDRQRNITSDAEQQRRRQALEMQRERILSERTSNTHRRSALSAALVDIEEKLSELGWIVKL